MSEFRIIHPTKNIISRKEVTRKWELINYLALGTSLFSKRQSDLVLYDNNYTMQTNLYNVYCGIWEMWIIIIQEVNWIII